MEKNICNGFDLYNYSHEDKAEALITLLKLNEDEDILEECQHDSNEFTVNPRKVKRGTSPKEYQTEIKLFKSLITKGQSTKIEEYILRDRPNEKIRKRLYNLLEKHLEKQKDTKAFKELAKMCMYCSNVAYHLLSDDSEEHINQYRRAFLGLKLKDTRSNDTENDGEYLVLTDSEADSEHDERLDNLLDECIIPELNNSNFECYFDRGEWKKDHGSDRGAELSGYDGSEECIEINGVDYYIYRTN